MRKRIFALLLALVMALGLTATAWANEPVTGVPYVDENGEGKTYTGTYTTVTGETGTLNGNDEREWSAGWYVVNSNVTINDTLKITGDVKLILCDGAKLGVTATSDYASGIKIEGTLTIYGQPGQTGVLTSAATDDAYHGIYVTTNSSLTVNGGNVTGTGNAVIAGSYGIEFGSGAPQLTVNGGTVTAIGSVNGTHSGTMTINGGTLIAEHTGATGHAVDSNLVPPTTTYWWRTVKCGDFTASSTSAYNKESTASYVEITTIEPVAAPPADEPEPDQEPAAPGHEPIRRQHVTAVEETTPDTDTKADEAKTDTVTSAKTFDTGVAVYGAMAVASLLGMGYVGKKRV